ncbi:NTP transferase domain-containing protein [candidate division WOR-3 bacterium]|nr:NTP transferase domain-containing protein [candidate division WOR-3 bacterium]
MKKFVCVILAAGKGKRMKSRLAKVLHPVCGKPMLFYMLELSKKLKIAKTIVVVGTQKEKVIEEFGRWDVSFVNQDRLLGTGDAVLRTKSALIDIKADVIVLVADTPLLKEITIKKMMRMHSENNSDITLLTTLIENPTGYGRIIRDGDRIVGIVEEKDATRREKTIKEINAGVYIFNKEKLFHYLRKIQPDNIQKEYYLTDVIRLIQKENGVINTLKIDDWREVIGINDRNILSRVSKVIEERLMEGLMKNGVTIVSPESTVINYGVKIGKDTIIHPFVSITGETVIGASCRIYSHSSIHKSIIGNNVVIKENCLVSSANIAGGVTIPAYSILGDEKKNIKKKKQ